MWKVVEKKSGASYPTDWRWTSFEKSFALKAETKKCHLSVLLLAATLARRALDAAFPVRYHDGRFHLVAMLAAWTRPPLAAHIALFE